MDTGLASISQARDYTHLIHAQLLLHKTEALWNLKESVNPQNCAVLYNQAKFFMV